MLNQVYGLSIYSLHVSEPVSFWLSLYIDFSTLPSWLASWYLIQALCKECACWVRRLDYKTMGTCQVAQGTSSVTPGEYPFIWPRDRYHRRHLQVVLWINILIWQNMKKISFSGLQHLFTRRDLILFVCLDSTYIDTDSWDDYCRPFLVSRHSSWRCCFSQKSRSVHKRKLTRYWIQGSMHGFPYFKICHLSRHWSWRYCDGVEFCLWELRVELNNKIFMRGM